MSNEPCGLYSGSHPIPLTGVEVQARITGRGARVKVIQNFLNVEDKAIEAVYKFPLPEGAAVCGFRALIDDRTITGEIEDRETAFALYDGALVKGDGAYLLDEERPNIFTLSVGNLPPGKTAAIEIEYVTLLETNDRETRFFLPTTISPRYVPADMPDRHGIPSDELINPPFQLQVPYGLSISITVHGADQVESLQSPSHTVNIAFPQEGTSSYAHDIIVTFADEKAAMDRDYILTVIYRQTFANRAFWCRYQGEIFIQADLCESTGGIFNRIAETSKVDSKEIVFVLDCSGSMGGSSIVQARKALEILLKALPPDAFFNIYCFGNTYEKKFPQSVPYSEVNLKAALSYIADINADLGGTEVVKPLKDIYQSSPAKGRKRHIILITDGEIGNEEQVLKLIKKGIRHSILHSVGIGYGSNEYLIRQAARTAGGACEFVAPGERIEPKVLRLFAKIASRSVRDLRVHLDNGTDQAPAHPFLLQGEAVTVLLKTREGTSLPEKLTLSGQTGNGDHRWEIPFLAISGADTPIPVLWAKEKIRDIEELADTGEGSQQFDRKREELAKDAITISKNYGVVSRETSYVAVEKRFSVGAESQKIILRKVPVMLTKDWGGLAMESAQKYPTSPSSIVQYCITSPAYMRDDLQISPMPFEDSSHTEDLEIPAYLRREASISVSPISSTASNEETLIQILSCQQPQGGFVWSKELAEMLGFSWEYLQAMADKMTVAASCDKYKLFYTMFTIKLLERKFGRDKSSWRAIVEKSHNWLQSELRRCQPSIDSLELEMWISKKL